MKRPIALFIVFLLLGTELSVLQFVVPVYAQELKTNAFITYRDSTTSLNTPKERTWTGESVAWGSQSEIPTSDSPIRFTRVAYSPILTRSTEKIVVTLSDDGYLDAYVWDGASWTATNNIGNVGTVANAYKSFDIAYEKTSGEALLVYSVVSTNTAQDLAYKTWTYGTGWSAESYIDDTGHATDLVYRWVSMASNPVSGSNEITMVAIDGSSSDANGWVWGGSSWGAIQSLDETVAITTKECIAVAYETTSGRAWTAVGSGTTASTINMRSQTAGAWNATKENPNVGGVPNWVTLKADPASNYLFLVSVDASSDLNTVYYSGSGAWTVHTEHDAAVDSITARCADFAWEPTGSKGLLVWGTANNVINWKSYTAPNTWPSNGAPSMTGGTHPWIQLRTNTRNIAGDMKILGAVLTATVLDLGGIRWDGTTFTIIGVTTFSSDTVITYESFEIEFMNFEPGGQEYSRSVAQSITVASSTATIGEYLKSANQGINIALSTAKLIEVTKEVTQEIGVSISSQRLADFFRSASQSIGIGLQAIAATIAEYMRDAFLTITTALTTSHLGEWFRSASQSITTAMQSAGQFDATRMVTQDLSLNLATARTVDFFREAAQTITSSLSVSSLIDITRTASQAVNMGLQSARLLDITRTATQTITTALQGLGSVVTEFLRSASLFVTTTLMPIASTQSPEKPYPFITWPEWPKWPTRVLDINIIDLTYTYEFHSIDLSRTVFVGLNVTNLGDVAGDVVLNWWINDAIGNIQHTQTQTLFILANESKVVVCPFELDKGSYVFNCKATILGGSLLDPPAEASFSFSVEYLYIAFLLDNYLPILIIIVFLLLSYGAIRTRTKRRRKSRGTKPKGKRKSR